MVEDGRGKESLEEHCSWGAMGRTHSLTYSVGGGGEFLCFPNPLLKRINIAICILIMAIYPNNLNYFAISSPIDILIAAITMTEYI